jgi:hypothetical protein
MNRYGGVEVWINVIFNLGTTWRLVASFTPRPLYPRERFPGTHCIGVSVDARIGDRFCVIITIFFFHSSFYISLYNLYFLGVC